MRVAHVLRSLNNYNTMMAILAGINSAPILRLGATRKSVAGREIWDRIEELEALMSSEKSFGSYRSALRASSGPCIPYLYVPLTNSPNHVQPPNKHISPLSGVFLRDLLYMDEANKDRRSDKTINLVKFLLIGDTLEMIQGFQRRAYPFVKDLAVLEVIFGQRILDGDVSSFSPPFPDSLFVSLL